MYFLHPMAFPLHPPPSCSCIAPLAIQKAACGLAGQFPSSKLGRSHSSAEQPGRAFITSEPIAQPPLQTTPAQPLPLMRRSCRGGQHGMGAAPRKGFSPLCAPGLPIPLHGLQSSNSQAGSWQIIPSTPGWTSQGTTGECHDSFQLLEDNVKSCSN